MEEIRSMPQENRWPRPRDLDTPSSSPSSSSSSSTGISNSAYEHFIYCPQPPVYEHAEAFYTQIAHRPLPLQSPPQQECDYSSVQSSTEDMTEKRKKQNRLAQRRYRVRQEQRAVLLSSKVGALEQRIASIRLLCLDVLRNSGLLGYYSSESLLGSLQLLLSLTDPEEPRIESHRPEFDLGVQRLAELLPPEARYAPLVGQLMSRASVSDSDGQSPLAVTPGDRF